MRTGESHGEQMGDKMFVKEPRLSAGEKQAMRVPEVWDETSLVAQLVALGDDQQTAISRAQYVLCIRDGRDVTAYLELRRQGVCHELAYSL